MKDEAEKAKFMGTKKNTVVTFNPNKAYEGNEAELSSFLKIPKEEVKDYTGDFSFEIVEITRYAEAELNQDLFDKVFGPDAVKTEEEFKEKIKSMIAGQYGPDSDYKFILDARKLLEKKAGDITFPDAFLKRWLLATSKERSQEALEEDYPRIIEDLKFHLVKEEIAKENNFKLEENEITEYAQRAVRAQFAQYGMMNVPDDLLQSYAKDMLKKEETVRNLIDKAMEDKLIAWLKEHVTLDTKEVTTDDFKALFS
jgi:trigger factor